MNEFRSVRRRLIAAFSTVTITLAASTVSSLALAGPASAVVIDFDTPFYKVTLSEPISVAVLGSLATDREWVLTSVQHYGETTGELLVGSKPLLEALEEYVVTNITSFGVAPTIESFYGAGDVDSLDLSGLSVASAQDSALPSVDPNHVRPIPGQQTPDVGEASTSKAWAPATGSIYGFNSSTGAERRVRHRLTWDTRAGLNYYNAGDDHYVYEHDHKLYDNSPYTHIYTGYGMTQTCSNDFWMWGDTVIVSSNNVPSTAKLYADNVRVSDECGTQDVSFGIYHPEKLAVDTRYTIVVGSDAGSVSSSPYGLQGQILIDQCPGDTERPECVSITDGPRDDRQPFVNIDRQWKMPGCFSWTRGQSPTAGVC